MKSRIFLLCFVIPFVFHAQVEVPEILFMAESHDLGPYTMDVEPLDSVPYIIDYWDTDLPSEEELIAIEPLVRRNKDSLIFSLKDGSEIALVDVPYSMDDPFERIEYQFLRTIHQNGFWEVMCWGYEYYYHLFINQRNGDKIETMGTGEFSPSGELLIIINTDYEAMYTPTGFEIIEVSDNSHNSIGMEELEEWGPIDIDWIDENRFLVRRARITDDYDYLITYAIGTIKKK